MLVIVGDVLWGMVVEPAVVMVGNTVVGGVTRVVVVPAGVMVITVINLTPSAQPQKKK